MNPTQLPDSTNRELQLELVRVRAEAAAARLEARAAELELMLIARRSDSPRSTAAEPRLPIAQSHYDDPARINDNSLLVPAEPQRVSHTEHQLAADALIAAIHQLLANQGNDHPAAIAQSGWADNSSDSGPGVVCQEADEVGNVIPATAPDTGWEGRLKHLQQRRSPASHSPESEFSEGECPVIVPVTETPHRRSEVAPATAAASYVPSTPDPGTLPNVAANPSEAPATTHTKTTPDHSAKEPSDFSVVDVPGAKAEPAVERVAPTNGQDREGASSASSSTAFQIRVGAPFRNRLVQPLEGVELQALALTDGTADETERRRFRPAAWLTSTVAHLLVLVVLGTLSLASQKPRDQLAFSAAVSETSAEVETFTIEASEALPEPSQQEPTEPALEVSPMGVIPVTELALELQPAAPAMEMFNTRPSAMNNLSQLFKGNTTAKVQFAGVEGGGNHFIYLVDSSKSMRNFNEARNELLRSVEALQTHQRFYVVFYDQSPDYMRLTASNIDEPTSALATAANKQALRRWAMTIQQQPGKSPTEVLPFAFKLRPDVIFLLSDGEFAAQTEEVIRKHNRQSNLFGEEGPISIIHTIRYPGYSAAGARNAEEQMKRIAAENGGQYRNIVIQ